MQFLVTDVQKIPGVSGRVRILLEGGEEDLAADLSTCRSMGLAPGAMLSQKSLEELRKKEHASALRRSLDYLQASARSQQQVQRYLERRCYDAGVIGEVVLALMGKGLIDDAALAARVVELQGQKRGRQAVAQSLYRKGIDREQIREAVSSITPGDEAAGIRALLPRLQRRYADRTPHDGKRLIAQALYRRGFSRKLISAALFLDEE